MTNAQFDALAELVRLRENSAARHAAMLVLAGGMDQADAAREAGTGLRNVKRAVNTCLRGVELVLAVVTATEPNPPRRTTGLFHYEEKIMKYEIKRRVGGDVVFECDLPPGAETWPETAKLGHAVRAAVRSRANLYGAALSGVDLSDANLSWADLSGVDLSDANLSGADLSWANLSGADLTGADLTCADLTGANLSGADLTGADLTGANLSGANLSGANLYAADLICASLCGADLTGADFSDANLSGANLYGANPGDANRGS